MIWKERERQEILRTQKKTQKNQNSKSKRDKKI
jgi:hypothetical protein